MKRILTFVLALSMALSLAACGGKADDNKKNDNNTEVTMTAQEIMDTLKEKLGDSFGCDVAETEDNISGYWGLDMGQVESWASMSNSNSAVNSSYAVIVKVKDGYAQDAAALLQTGYEQILSYSRMYNMDLQKVLQARLFVNGNYVALLILGAQGDWEASDRCRLNLLLRRLPRRTRCGAASSVPPITASPSRRTTAAATTVAFLI